MGADAGEVFTGEALPLRTCQTSLGCPPNAKFSHSGYRRLKIDSPVPCTRSGRLGPADSYNCASVTGGTAVNTYVSLTRSKPVTSRPAGLNCFNCASLTVTTKRWRSEFLLRPRNAMLPLSAAQRASVMASPFDSVPIVAILRAAGTCPSEESLVKAETATQSNSQIVDSI